MKVLHICVTGPYTDGFNYQENLLTKYQVKAGHDVYIIASEWQWEKGNIVKYQGKSKYNNLDGVHINRLPIKNGKDVFYRFKRFIGFLEAIDEIQPDTIFIHNLQFFDIDKIQQYAKKHSIRIFADNHADFSNSARNRLALLFYKTIWRHEARLIEPYTLKFYGVLPARVDFLKNVYGLPEIKCELLVMGADDEEVEKASKSERIQKTKQELGFNNEDFIIVTGGKIDAWKKQTFLLMRAILEIQKTNLKLLIFGPVSEDIKSEFERNFDYKCMKYVSWANSEQAYQFFAIADLVVFPGRHSVYWEQAAGQGKPMLCKYWKGTTHIDIGGNVKFLMEDSVEEIRDSLISCIDNGAVYQHMLKVAMEGKEKFSYKRIAAMSIE